MKKYFKLMRVHHYIKNLLVFAALASSGQLFNTTKLINCFLAFLAFCFISSIVYIINDIMDKEKDALHPTKKNRPIANGSISISSAWFLTILLFVFSMIINFFIFNPYSSTILIGYLLLNLLYSFKLKNIPILDISILVSGFLIRMIYGAIVTQIEISNWLYLTVLSFSFYFALGKRRNELKNIGDNSREVLSSYSESFLDKNMGMFLTLGNAFYALWSMDEKTIAEHSSNLLVFTVPIVLLITLKYSLTIEGESDGDPVEVLIKDKTLLFLTCLYILSMFLILYLIK